MKGSRTDQFEKGQQVAYTHRHGFQAVGTVVKVHKSGKQGSVEIKPSDGGKKVTRMLQNVLRV